MAFATAPIKRICIENPVGIMSRVWREPDQIIQPYYFGDEFQKTTCLWLKNLPPLQHAAEDDWFATKTHVGKGEMVRYESGKVMPKCRTTRCTVTPKGRFSRLTGCRRLRCRFHGRRAAIPETMTLKDAANAFEGGYAFGDYVGEISCNATLFVDGQEIESLAFALDNSTEAK